jgi:DNA-directed RNA polymerase subunit RPC12/RpoP
MSHVKFEFSCSNCSKIFDIKLNMSLDGNYRIHCPMCSHVHYRVVKQGKITDERFPQNEDKILIEDIVPMKSSCRDFAKEKTEDSEVSGAVGFLKNLWKERFSCQT